MTHYDDYPMAEDNNKSALQLLDNNRAKKRGNRTKEIRFAKVLVTAVSKCATLGFYSVPSNYNSILFGANLGSCRYTLPRMWTSFLIPKSPDSAFVHSK